MKGDAIKIVKFFDGSSNRFKIPLYQRNYDWTEENCRQLLSDLKKLNDPNRKSHFFGSIVTKTEDDTHIIIDGQQRITTLSILFIAILNAYKNEKIGCTQTNKVDYIRNTYLEDQYSEGEYKLIPVDKDAKAYNALIEGSPVVGSNLTRNYDFFYREICNCDLSLEDWIACVQKLEIIDIRLERDDEPQLIFESLNSTGKDLTEADKIRNYLLMSLNDKEQSYCYKHYWQKIEENTSYDTTPFFRDFLTVKNGKMAKIDQIYKVFKEFVENTSIGREDIMKEMLVYSGYNKKILDASFSDSDINRKIKEINSTGLSIVVPYLLAFFRYADEQGMTDKLQYKVLDVVENYMGRRIICNMPSNALTKVFSTLHKEILKLMEANPNSLISLTEPYLEVLKYYLLQRQGVARFPDEKIDLEPNFKVRQVYLMPKSFRTFIMERMENGNSNEVHDVVKELSGPDSKISIEHIMPQTLTQDWKDALGTNYEEIHKTYLHTMANLTLTGYNSSYSNKKFTDKRDATNGFKESNYRLNNYVKTCDQWTVTEIQKRQKLLYNKVLEIWPNIQTNFKPAEKPISTVSLEDDTYDFTYKSIKAYTLFGKRTEVSKWVDMFVKVCLDCYQSDNASFLKLVDADKFKYSLHSQPGPSLSEVTDGIYVWTGNSTTSKLSVLRTIFEGMGIEQNELEFEINQGSQTQAKTTAGEMHQKFWAQFNEYASQQSEFTKEFTLKPGQSQKDWHSYDFHIGESDYHLVITLNTQEKSINTGIWCSTLNGYDKVYSAKQKLENELGYEFSWNSAKTSGSAYLKRFVDNMYDESAWPEFNEWFVKYLLLFKAACLKYIH